MAPEASQAEEAQANCGRWSRAAVPAGSEGAMGPAEGGDSAGALGV
jgi:hypothetical protein